MDCVPIKMPTRKHECKQRTGLLQAADEETLPFKTLHCLSHELGLRLYAYPESTHSSWNDCKNGIRRAGKQYVILLATVLANASHGPYGGGKTHQTIIEAATDLALNMDASTFQALLEDLALDMQIEAGSELLPRSAAELPDLPAIRNLPPYVPCLLITAGFVALDSTVRLLLLGWDILIWL